jgi:hypothetical protein
MFSTLYMYRNIRCDRWRQNLLETKPELSYRFHAWAVVERRGGRSWQDVTLACPSRGIESIAHESLTHKPWLKVLFADLSLISHDWLGIVRWFVADKSWLTDLADKLKRTGQSWPSLWGWHLSARCRGLSTSSILSLSEKSNYGIHVSQKSSSLTKFIANIISIYVSKQI